MKKVLVWVGAGLLLALMVAAIVPLWMMTAGIGMSTAGYGAVILMVVFCFGLAGALMFLVFYSARSGHDDLPRLDAPDEQQREPPDL
jgi:uncharacterized sodium:solute symporter family permease YidK